MSRPRQLQEDYDEYIRRAENRAKGYAQQEREANDLLIIMGQSPGQRTAGELQAVRDRLTRARANRALQQQIAQTSFDGWLNISLREGKYGEWSPTTGLMSEAPEGADSFLARYVNNIFGPVGDPEGLGAKGTPPSQPVPSPAELKETLRGQLQNLVQQSGVSLADMRAALLGGDSEAKTRVAQAIAEVANSYGFTPESVRQGLLELLPGVSPVEEPPIYGPPYVPPTQPTPDSEGLGQESRVPSTPGDPGAAPVETEESFWSDYLSSLPSDTVVTPDILANFPKTGENEDFDGDGVINRDDPNFPPTTVGDLPESVTGDGTGEGGEAVTTELTAEQQEFFRKQFGGLAFFMEKAELYDIVLQVAREGITDPNRVLGLVQQTDWYQNNSALTRQFDVGYAEEGEAGQRELIDDQYEAINQAARRLGFVIEDERLQELAYQATRLGMDTGEVNDLIAAEQNFDPGYLGDAAKRLASKYYISLDDASADEYGTQLFVGDMTQQTLESMFMEQAKGRFPSLSNIIDSGVSPQTYFAPYKAQIAQLLEIDSNQIDLMNDTRFSTIIDHIPEAGGEARPMTMNEMQRYVRRLDDWQYTDNAKASASRLADAIGARFGRTA